MIAVHPKTAKMVDVASSHDAPSASQFVLIKLGGTSA